MQRARRCTGTVDWPSSVLSCLTPRDKVAMAGTLCPTLTGSLTCNLPAWLPPAPPTMLFRCSAGPVPALAPGFTPLHFCIVKTPSV